MLGRGQEFGRSGMPDQGALTALCVWIWDDANHLLPSSTGPAGHGDGGILSLSHRVG